MYWRPISPSSCFLLVLSLIKELPFVAASGTSLFASIKVYTAKILPIPGVETDIFGTVVVVTMAATRKTEESVETTSSPLFYGGFLQGLPSMPEKMDCKNAVNGCGFHIHEGTGCHDTAAQGRHYFNSTVIADDPWITARYSFRSNGSGSAGAVLEIGTNNVVGRAVVVHAQDGSRIGCGLLEEVDDDTLQLYHTHTVPLSSPSLWSISPGDGEVVVIDNIMSSSTDDKDDRHFLCYMGYASGLASNLQSAYAIENAGTDCTDANACGTHIHNGHSCKNAATQGGHWYDKATMGTDDPWARLGYERTSSTGEAWYGACTTIVQSSSDVAGAKPFIVHDSHGSRVSCGELMNFPFIVNSNDESTAFKLGAALMMAALSAIATLVA